MNAAILAQKLSLEARSLMEPDNNAMYLPWVRDADIRPLLALALDKKPGLSILSSNLVEGISRKYLLHRYSLGSKPAIDQHPAAADKLLLGLAMANLDGVDYAQPIASGGQFIYTRFQDEFIRRHRFSGW